MENACLEKTDEFEVDLSYYNLMSFQTTKYSVASESIVDKIIHEMIERHKE